MKKSIAVLLCVLLWVSLAGCGSGNSAPAPTQAPAASPAEESAPVSTPTPAPDPSEEPAPSEENGNGAAFSPEFTFTAPDRDGNEWTEQIFAGKKLTMINFWEPWCPPCVGEMPDLQKLSEDYADRGFQIIGVYSEQNMEQEVDELLEKSGVRYLLLRYVPEFQPFESGYVPTTVFVDGEGHVLTVNGEKLIIGSNSYEGWAAIVEGLL